jgi:hypothetical protein
MIDGQRIFRVPVTLAVFIGALALGGCQAERRARSYDIVGARWPRPISLAATRPFTLSAGDNPIARGPRSYNRAGGCGSPLCGRSRGDRAPTTGPGAVGARSAGDNPSRGDRAPTIGPQAVGARSAGDNPIARRPRSYNPAAGDRDHFWAPRCLIQRR